MQINTRPLQTGVLCSGNTLFFNHLQLFFFFFFGGGGGGGGGGGEFSALQTKTVPFSGHFKKLFWMSKLVKFYGSNKRHFSI